MTYVWLGRAKLELDECNSSLLHPNRTTSRLDDGLVKNQSINHLTLIYRAAQFLHNADISEVDVFGGLGINDFENGINGHWTE